LYFVPRIMETMRSKSLKFKMISMEILKHADGSWETFNFNLDYIDILYITWEIDVEPCLLAVHLGLKFNSNSKQDLKLFFRRSAIILFGKDANVPVLCRLFVIMKLLAGECLYNSSQIIEVNYHFGVKLMRSG